MAVFQRFAPRTRNTVSCPTRFISKIHSTPTPLSLDFPTRRKLGPNGVAVNKQISNKQNSNKQNSNKQKYSKNAEWERPRLTPMEYTITSYNKKLTEHSKASDYTNFDHTVQDMERQGIPLTPATLSIRLYALEKQRRLRELYELWGKAIELGVSRDVRAYSSYCMALLRDGKTSELSHVIEEMERLQMPLNLAFYHRCLDVCASTLNWDRFLHWTQRLYDSKLVLDEASYVLLLNGFRRMGQGKFVQDTWDHILKRGSVPENAYCIYGAWLYRSGKYTEWAEIREKMKTSGSGSFWTTTASECFAAQDWAKFDEIIKEVKELKLANDRTYQLILVAYQKQKRWLDSIATYKEYKELQLPPQEDIFSHTIVAAIECGDVDYALVVFDDMVQVKPLSALMFNRWFAACLRTKQWRAFAEFDARMKEAGVKPSPAIEGTRSTFLKRYQESQSKEKKKQRYKARTWN